MTQVDNLDGAAEESAGGARFSLLFDGRGNPGFPQGTYTVSHAALGTFAVFLVPVGRDGGQYQAVINRSRR